MQWINETDLAKWAERVDARILLADMVADLIRATITDASRFRFPGGDVGQIRGWDGDLETSEGVSFIPAGKSKWEFGAGAGAKKALGDYEKRTSNTDAAVMKENTLVLVNLEAWDTPREKLTEWEDERNAEGKWLKVKYIDAVSLVHWLDEHPAVAALYAREVMQNAPKDGAISTDEFWEMYSLQFNPRLHETVVVADRKDIADELVQRLVGSAQSFMLGAETSEEVVAFAVAAIRLSPPEIRRSIEVRTLIIESESAARFLSQRSAMTFIAWKGADLMAGVLSQHAPTLSAATGTQARKHQFLRRPTASSMSEGFVAMGLDHQAGYELAHRCGRSLTILKRLIPNGPASSPAWESFAPLLKPAFLAGGWSATTDLDKQILSNLSGLADYQALESQLLPTLALTDPPLDRVREYWQVRAPVDAFSVYAQLLGDGDLQRFRDAVISVFSHVVKGPSREEKFSLTYTSPADYSKWLRDGLAFTLLIIATMHEVGGLQMNNATPQQYVDEILSALPDFGKTHEILVGLGDQTALFAEAAPNPFLRALESMLEGVPEELAKVFATNDNDIWGPSSPHIRILWALEALAWDPKYLNRTAIVLAKLAEIDPDPASRMVNRPINSLRTILLSWSPNTYASLSQRIACLDLIIAACPDVGWQLLVKLMPQSQDTSSPTQKPKLRDSAPMVLEELTFGLVWDAVAAIAKRAIQAAGDDEERIIVLVKHFSSFQPDIRAEIIAYIEEKLSQYQTPEGRPVWHALREEVARHEYFADADWAMKQDERDEIISIVERYQPTDPLVTEQILFDDWTPYVGRYNEDADNTELLRKEALDRVLMREGPIGILRLARMVKIPSLIGQALGLTAITEEQLLELLGLVRSEALPSDLSFYASAIGVERYDEHWKKEFKDQVIPLIPSADEKARLMLGWPLDQSTWSFIRALGDDVYDAYWRQTQTLPIRGKLEDLLFVIDNFRKIGRHLDVLCLIHNRIQDLTSKLILSLLSDGQQQLSEGNVEVGTMLSYYLNKAFLSLQSRNDVKLEDIARLEYAYFPLFEREKRQLTLYDFLLSEPAFFVEVLSHVFRGKNTPTDTIRTEHEKARAKVSYRLLSSFKSVPGLNGVTNDAKVLNRWVDGVRESAATADLSEIADHYVGYILAHSPQDPADSFWPPKAVCEIIERIASEDIEKGIRTECFNKRGVVTRGIYDGGTLERADASRYQSWATATAQYPRTSALLIAISEIWLHQAREMDVRAELTKMER